MRSGFNLLSSIKSSPNSLINSVLLRKYTAFDVSWDSQKLSNNKLSASFGYKPHRIAKNRNLPL